MTPKSTLRLLALGVWAIGVFFGTIANGADSTQIPTISGERYRQCAGGTGYGCIVIECCA